jgi:hypothetical protein
MDDEDYFDEKFWRNNADWPRDREDGVFLARVILKIENEMNPEPLSEPAELRSDLSEAEFEQMEDAEAEYEAEFLRRRRQAVEKFIASYRAAKFECFKVSKTGEEVQALPEPIWASQRCDHWFRYCDFAPDSSHGGWSNAKPWLFVTKSSFESYFGKPTAPLGLSNTVTHYSPYMLLMMEVIRDWEIDPGYQPTTTSLNEEFVRRWKERSGTKLSAKLASAMATLVREVESGKGGHNKSRRKK